MSKFCFGVDLGGTTVKLGLFDVQGNALEKWEIPTVKENNGSKILPDIADSVLAKMKEKNIAKNEVVGVGIGVPGPVNDEGVVFKAVNLGWDVMNINETLGGLLDMPVKAGNDANVAALGEMWCGGVDGQILQFRGILVSDPVGGSQLLAEHGSHILDGNAVLAGGGETLAPAGDGIAGQLGTVAFQQVGDLQSEDLGALVHKAEGKIHGTGLIEPVVLLGNLRQIGHFLHAVAQNLAHFPNTQGNLHQLIDSGLTGHKRSPFMQQKTAPRQNLRRV